MTAYLLYRLSSWLASDSLIIKLSMIHGWRPITYLLNRPKPMVARLYLLFKPPKFL